MSIRDKILKESIKAAEKRLKEINKILDSNPLQEIIELRKETQEKLDEARENGTELSSEFMDYISDCAKKERELFALAEKRRDMVALIEEKVKVENELSNLITEKSYIDNKKL